MTTKKMQNPDPAPTPENLSPQNREPEHRDHSALDAQAAEVETARRKVLERSRFLSTPGCAEIP